MTADLRILVEQAQNALAGDSALIGAGANQEPRYDLFHAPNSICAQKVRTVLAYHDIAYTSRPVNLFQGESYLPGYVRLRMAGCEAIGGAMANYHSGSTSAEMGGCDGAVVPTLVDWQENRVIVDSKKICVHIDAQIADADRLRPGTLADAIDKQLEIVDNIPNYQMLMGRTPNAAEAAQTKGSIGSDFSTRKVAWCDRYLAEHADEPILVKAYIAKKSKEQSAADILFSSHSMADAYEKAEAALQTLETELGEHEGAWIFGYAVTMADIFWGIELLRMENLGVSHFWDGRLPRVTKFLASAAKLPAIKAAILDWPGATF